MNEQTTLDALLYTAQLRRQESEDRARIGAHSLSVEPDEAAAAVISLLSNRDLKNVAPALAALTEANSLANNPAAIRQSLARQVPVLEALMHRLILSACSAKPEVSCRYLGTAMTVQAALLKVLGAIYETRET